MIKEVKEDEDVNEDVNEDINIEYANIKNESITEDIKYTNIKNDKDIYNNILLNNDSLNVDDEITNGSMLLNKGIINNELLQKFLDKDN